MISRHQLPCLFCAGYIVSPYPFSKTNAMQKTVRIVLFLLIGVSFFSCDEGTYFNDYETVNASVVLPDTAGISDTLEARSRDLASRDVDNEGSTLWIKVNKLEMAIESPQSAIFDNLEFLEVYLVNNSEQEKIGWMNLSYGTGLRNIELSVREESVNSLLNESHYRFIIKTKLKEPLEADWSLKIICKFKIERSDPRFV